MLIVKSVVLLRLFALEHSFRPFDNVLQGWKLVRKAWASSASAVLRPGKQTMACGLVKKPLQLGHSSLWGNPHGHPLDRCCVIIVPGMQI
jgi:hypothetical protein